MKQVKGLLVVIPHAGLKRPKEIKKEWLSKYEKQFLFSDSAETDRGTDKLYDFRKVLGNKQLIFPFSQVYINVCRDPKKLDGVIPPFIREIPIYQPGKELSEELRNKLLRKYYLPFYEKIRRIKKSLILDGHSTITEHASLGEEKLEDDIVLSDWLDLNGKVIRFAPKKLVDFYADELRKRLPYLKIGRNSAYVSSYDYICASFGWNGKTRRNGKVPVIHQETDESLYIKKGDKIDYKKLNNLRNAFAESLYSTMKILQKVKS